MYAWILSANHKESWYIKPKMVGAIDNRLRNFQAIYELTQTKRNQSTQYLERYFCILSTY